MRAWSCAAASRALADDLLGGGDGLLGFLLLDPRGCGAGLLDQLGGLGVGLRQNFLPLRFGAGQLGFDLLGVGQAFGDALAALFKHGQDALVSEEIEQDADDAKS